MVDPVVSITINDRATREAIKLLQQKAINLEPAHKQIGEYLVLSTDERFRTETDPDGNKWTPLKAKTIQRKQAEGKILRVLQATGLMRSRINYSADDRQVTIGTSDRKAPFHQLGTSKIPQRRFLGLGENDIAEVQAIYQEHLTSRK